VAPEDGQQLPLEFFGLGQPVPAAGWDLNLPPDDNAQAEPADNIQGDWDQWIVNAPPVQQPQQDLPPDEQQVTNPHSDLSSDSSSGPALGVPVQNGQIQNGQIPTGLDVIGPVLPFNAPALPVVDGVPLNDLQEIDGPPIQGGPHVPGDIVLPDAQPGGPNINGPNIVELNYMFAQDWRPDPVLLSHLERKRNAQFYRIWANYFAPADIPSALLESADETLPLAIPKKCPDGKFLEAALQEDPTGNVSTTPDLASRTSKPAVVESDLRRSKRLRDARAGFRQGSCQRKNCLMCQDKSEGPPSLSAKNIRRLGERFCNLSEEDLSDIALKKKKKNPFGCVGSDKPENEDSGDQNQDPIDEDN
jgi:hypothetical protein